jgi:AraC family transcriptional regulator
MNQPGWAPLRNLRVQSAGTHVASPGSTFGPRRQPSHEFVWIRAGSMRVTVNSIRRVGPPGTLFLVLPGVRDRYDGSKRERIVTSFLHFELGPLPPGWPPRSRWPLSRRLPEDNILFRLFQEVLSYSPFSEERFEPLLNPAVELMLRLYLGGTFEAQEPGWQAGLSPPLERVIPWLKVSIEGQPSRKIGLSDMARQALVSPQHLCRLFKKELQIGPMECARLLRAEAAGTLLERSQLTVKEISDKCGFENPFHFSRVFKDVVGVPPMAYRKGFLEGQLFRPGSPVFSRYRYQRVMINRAVKTVDQAFRLAPKRYRTRIV